MSRIFENTLTAVQPECAVTFGQSRYTAGTGAAVLCAAPGLPPHAYAMILLRQAGTPCVFYGDYYGFP